MRKSLIVFLLFWSSTLFAAFNSLAIYQFTTAQQQNQFQQLTYQLRCLVCQNQDLAESNASLAADLRTQIAEKIRGGQSNQRIIQYLVTRYGDFILYKPPIMNSTYFLWFGPFLLLIITSITLLVRITYLKKIKSTNLLTDDKARSLEKSLRNP